jgi:hypothetical protein
VLAQRVPNLALLREEQGVSDGDEISARFLTYGRVEHRHSACISRRHWDRARAGARFVHKKIPGVFDSARDMLPVAHDDSPTLLGIYTQGMAVSRRCS